MDINQATGQRIRKLRNINNMTLDELAEKIHKSKATLSKYEIGQVKIDLQTLEEIARVLKVSIHDLLPPLPSEAQTASNSSPIRLFSDNVYDEASDISADHKAEFYLYFYGGANPEVREALIELNRINGDTMMYCDPYQKSNSIGCSFFYRGHTIYFDSKYRIELHNHFSDHDIFIIQCADSMAGSTSLLGLLSYYAAGQYNSFSAKCLLSSTKLTITENLRNVLKFSKEELKVIKRQNAIYSTDMPQAFEILSKK